MGRQMYIATIAVALLTVSMTNHLTKLRELCAQLGEHVKI